MVGNVSPVVQALISNVDKVVRGKREEIRLAVCCLLTEGHLLLDDVPGTGKTTLAKAIAGSISGTWKRVQFTPDLLPTDITGVMIYDQRDMTFNFREGPVFTNVLIGDEINRGSPKTQSALLEVMEERQVTSDGITHRVPHPFFVIATQNPRDYQGTFPLPDVQLDRFTMRLTLGYADPATEVGVLGEYHRHRRDEPVHAVTDTNELDRLIGEVDQIEVVESINDYIVRLAGLTRTHPDLRLGVSTRGTLSLLRVARAYAATEERSYVTPDDVKSVVATVFAHRMALTPEAELRGVRIDKLLADIVDEIPVPRTASSEPLLTRSGVGALVAAVLLGGCGLWWHYEELIGLAVGVGGLVLMAVWAAQRSFRVSIRRRLTSPRVARGDPIRIVYRVINDGRHRSGRAAIRDHCGDESISVAVEPLGKQEAVDLPAEIPTRRRGIFEVGPWSIERLDPFGLAIGHREGDSTSAVIVHPRVYDLLGPHGSMNTVEAEALVRRTATDPLSGFVSLREYVPGDDPRLIHWMTTARTGTLMVKEHVELRRPEFTVVLDTAHHVATPDDFEEAVDVAASIAVHAVRSGLDVVVRTTSRDHPGHPIPRSSESQVVDLLTPVQQASGVDLLSVATLFRTGIDQAAIILITGPDGPSSRLGSSEQMLTVRIGTGAQSGPGVALAVGDAREFTQRWKPWSG